MQAFPMHQNPGAVVFNRDAKLLKTGNGGKAVCALKEICNLRQPIGNGAKHNSPVGNGFIAGDRQFPMKRMLCCDFHVVHLSYTV